MILPCEVNTQNQLTLVKLSWKDNSYQLPNQVQEKNCYEHLPCTERFCILADPSKSQPSQEPAGYQDIRIISRSLNWQSFPKVSLHTEVHRHRHREIGLWILDTHILSQSPVGRRTRRLRVSLSPPDSLSHKLNMERYTLRRKGELFCKLPLPNIIYITVLMSRERQVTLLEHIASKEKPK